MDNTIETLRAQLDDLQRRYNLLDESEKRMAGDLRVCQAARGVLVTETAHARDERDKAQAKLLAVREILERATVASCDCLTRTPDPNYHKDSCPYKIYSKTLAAL